MFSTYGGRNRPTSTKTAVTYGKTFKIVTTTDAEGAQTSDTKANIERSVWDVEDEDDDELATQTPVKVLPSRTPKANASKPSPLTKSIDLVRRPDKKLSANLSATKVEADPYALPDSPPRSPPRTAAAMARSKQPESRPASKKSTQARLPRERNVQKLRKPNLITARSKSDLPISVSKVTKSTSSPELAAVRTSNDFQSQPLPDVDFTFDGPFEEEPVAAMEVASLQRASPAPPRKRRRLIDALVAQADDSSEASSEEELQDEATESSRQARQRTPDTHIATSVVTSVPNTPERSRTREAAFATSARKKAGPRFTYGAARRVLEEEVRPDVADNDDALLGESLLPEAPPKDTFDLDDDSDADGGGAAAMRSIHELRQAGANSRSADEIDDLLERSGRPGNSATALRRNALASLAQRAHDKGFCRQLRDHVGVGKLFQSLDREEDRLAGLALAAIATTVLTNNTAGPFANQLVAQHVVALLARLLKVESDIAEMIKDRAFGLSRLSRHSWQQMERHLLELPIWLEQPPTVLSPRRLALVALHLLLQQSADIVNHLSSDVVDQLFAVLAQELPSVWHELVSGSHLDFVLAMRILEPISVPCMLTDGAHWSRTQTPRVIKALQVLLDGQEQRLDDTGISLLKVASNMANNNGAVSLRFARSGIANRWAELAARELASAITLVADVEAFEQQLPVALLMLGGLINVCEHDQARAAFLQSAAEQTSSPIEKLIRVYLSHHAATSEADSVEKGQLNVAIGYLAILLGYLVLEPTVRQSFRTLQGSKDLLPLLSTIREFVAFHQAADNDAMRNDESDRPKSGTAVKLQTLVSRLQVAAHE